LTLMRELAKKHPEGPLFRTKEGNRWIPTTYSKRFRVLREKVGLPRLTCYTYRHQFATNWLKAGRSIDLLAELMGNTPNIIRKHYAHLCGDHKGIRKQLEEFINEMSVAGETESPHVLPLPSAQ
jgi:integrase